MLKAAGGGGGGINPAQKGAPGGVAPLDASGKLPASYLPTIPTGLFPHSHTAAEVGAISTAELGVGNGVATLDASGKLTAAQLPTISLSWSQVTGKPVTFPPSAHVHVAADVGAVAVAEKGAANGVATLDASGKVPASQLPGASVSVEWGNIASKPSTFPPSAHVHSAADVGAVALAEKGAASGVATLDASGKVPKAQLSLVAADVGAVAAAEKGAANGVATLDAGGKVSASQLPSQLAGSPHGQCRLEKSAGGIILLPFNGNNIIVNGVVRTIPASGIEWTTAPTANTTYYVYLYDNAGTLALEINATGYSRHTNGVYTKTGDTSRTLVGMARGNASGQWVDSLQQRFVLSWFNRRRKRLGLPGVSRSTASTVLVETSSADRNEFLNWAGEVVSQQLVGQVTHSFSGSATTYCGVGMDNASSMYVVQAASMGVGWLEPVSIAGDFDASEGYHYIVPLIAVNAATVTVTVSGTGSISG
ncbi:hypothetical protein [Leeia sp.]|uniref:hypothetical protein n=1 Tax=Leeia sp. TaxID=2884678 RepID=UPI0035AEC7E4